MYSDPSSVSAPVKTNTMALTSVISAVVAWVLGGLGSCGISLFFPPASVCTGLVFVAGCLTGVVTGHMARSQIRARGGAETGQGLAVAGLVLGWIGLGMVILSICLGLVVLVALVLLGPSIGNVFSNTIIDI